MSRARLTFWKRRVVGKLEKWEFDCIGTHCAKNADFLDVRAIVALNATVRCLRYSFRLLTDSDSPGALFVTTYIAVHTCT